jgi:hypothetical protein
VGCGLSPSPTLDSKSKQLHISHNPAPINTFNQTTRIATLIITYQLFFIMYFGSPSVGLGAVSLLLWGQQASQGSPSCVSYGFEEGVEV